MSAILYLPLGLALGAAAGVVIAWAAHWIKSKP